RGTGNAERGTDRAAVEPQNLLPESTGALLFRVPRSAFRVLITDPSPFYGPPSAPAQLVLDRHSRPPTFPPAPGPLRPWPSVPHPRGSRSRSRRSRERRSGPRPPAAARVRDPPR